MKRVELLDCTLRDGGRIIDCRFKDSVIEGISDDLTHAGVEIIELGFLRDKDLVCYTGDSTFFTGVHQMDRFVADSDRALYCAFIDYGMYDFADLCDKGDTRIGAIRVGFTKKDFETDEKGIRQALNDVKSKGYKLFVQGVNTPGYADKQLLDVIDMVNEVQPYSFGIVDTYGSLYLEDLTYIYSVVEHNLNKNIRIDIHSHNNFQSSFAFAQEVLRVSSEDRVIILDATLNGMGKCAGNLNTELIVDYLNRKTGKEYDLNLLLDCIDRYLVPLKRNLTWGYSIPAFMAGIYKTHPNNVIYLTEKFRLRSKDIKYILAAIDEEKRQRYDYDNIQRIYREYSSCDIDDSKERRRIREVIKGKKVLVIAPGKSVLSHTDELARTSRDKEVIVISISFIPDIIHVDYLFCANALHWGRLRKQMAPTQCIITSNIKENIQGTIYINYSSYLGEVDQLADNSMIMLLNLLYECDAGDIMLAGFDGLQVDSDNYVSEEFVDSGHGISIADSNSMIKKMYDSFLKKAVGKVKVSMLTPSLFEESENGIPG